MNRIVNLSGCWAAADMLYKRKDDNPRVKVEQSTVHSSDDIFNVMLNDEMRKLDQKYSVSGMKGDKN